MELGAFLVVYKSKRQFAAILPSLQAEGSKGWTQQTKWIKLAH